MWDVFLYDPWGPTLTPSFSWQDVLGIANSSSRLQVPPVWIGFKINTLPLLSPPFFFFKIYLGLYLKGKATESNAESQGKTKSKVGARNDIQISNMGGEGRGGHPLLPPQAQC